MEKDDYKSFFKKIKGKKRELSTTNLLLQLICVFVIVADKLPTCLLVQQGITRHKEYKADCCTGNMHNVFQVRYLTGLNSSHLHCMNQE